MPVEHVLLSDILYGLRSALGAESVGKALSAKRAVQQPPQTFTSHSVTLAAQRSAYLDFQLHSTVSAG